MKVGRRDFLSGILGAGSASLLVQDLPAPEESGIEHVVVVMMENRSFDHLLGWPPNGDGMQDGITFVDRDGIAHSTHHLSSGVTPFEDGAGLIELGVESGWPIS